MMNRMITTRTPRTSFRHTTSGMELTIPLPGVAPDSLRIEVQDDKLRIQATSRKLEFEGLNLVHSEFTTGDFDRTYLLPKEVDRDSIEAELEHGMLRVQLRERAPDVRRIPISTN